MKKKLLIALSIFFFGQYASAGVFLIPSLGGAQLRIETPSGVGLVDAVQYPGILSNCLLTVYEHSQLSGLPNGDISPVLDDLFLNLTTNPNFMSFVVQIDNPQLIASSPGLSLSLLTLVDNAPQPLWEVPFQIDLNQAYQLFLSQNNVQSQQAEVFIELTGDSDEAYESYESNCFNVGGGSVAVCGSTIANTAESRNHFKLVNGKKVFSCNIQGCPEQFTNNHLKSKHHRAHFNENRNCPMCSKAFDNFRSFAWHIARCPFSFHK